MKIWECDFSTLPDATLPGVFRLDMQPHVFQSCLHASACPITVATTFQAQEGVLIHGEARKKGICAGRALGWAIGEYPAVWVQPFVAEASNSFICFGDKQQSFGIYESSKGLGPYITVLLLAVSGFPYQLWTFHNGYMDIGIYEYKYKAYS